MLCRINIVLLQGGVLCRGVCVRSIRFMVSFNSSVFFGGGWEGVLDSLSVVDKGVLKSTTTDMLVSISFFNSSNVFLSTSLHQHWVHLS
jgi:hypothetical protein